MNQPTRPWHPQSRMSYFPILILPWTVLLLTTLSAQALPLSTGPNGARVNITKLPTTFGLTGTGVVLGQVEGGRPGDLNNPAGGPAETNHPNVNPGTVGTPIGVARVIQVAGSPVIQAPAPANTNLSDHAERVAGVLISNHPTSRAPAHAATLFSSAYVSTGAGTQDEAIVASEWVRTANSANIINFSFLKFLDNNQHPAAVAIRDGDSLLSQYVDFATVNSNTLFVQAGPEDTRTIGSPWDAYNNIVVGFTATGPGGRYDRIDPASNQNMVIPDGGAAATRNKLDMVAPGNMTSVPSIDANGNGAIGDVGLRGAAGTSFAAPLVASTAALLHQHRVGISGNSSALGKKVLLLNSASKHVLDQSGVAWPVAHATRNPIPTLTFSALDPDTGVGQLNGLAALRGANAGNSRAGFSTGTVAAGGTSVSNLFVGGETLKPGSLVTATITWDRIVANATGNLTTVGAYASSAPPDVDLELVNRGTGAVVAKSLSSNNNVEHIYFNVRTEGDYDLRIRNTGAVAATVASALTVGTSDGLAFSVDGGAFNTSQRHAGTVPPNPAEGQMAPFGNNSYPNDVNALGTVGPAFFPTESELFVSSRNGTNMQRISGALGTRSRVGPHNAPPAAMSVIAPAANKGVLGLIPNDNVVGLSWGTDGADFESVLVFSVDPISIGAADVFFQSTVSPAGGGPATPFPDNPGGGAPGLEAAGDIFKTPRLDPFGAFPSALLGPAVMPNKLFIDEIDLGLQAPTGSGDSIGFEDDLDALEMDNLRLSVDQDGDGIHDSPVYFNLDRFSPSAFGGAPGASPDDIFVSMASDPTPGTFDLAAGAFGFSVFADGIGDIGLLIGDAVDALILSNIFSPSLDPLADEALFSIDPASPSIAALGASPGDVYYTDFFRPWDPTTDWKLGGSLFASAGAIGLLPSDNLNALDIFTVPEPVSIALTVVALVWLLALRQTRP